MGIACKIDGGFVPNGSSCPFRARVLGTNDQPILQATVSSIAYRVTDKATGQVVGSGSLNKTVVVFDQLQRSTLWTVDSVANPGKDGQTGWNFSWTIPGTLLSVGVGRTVEARVFFTMTNGDIVEALSSPIKLV